MSTIRVAAYITGHGFGHATRSIEVLEALRTRCPDLEIHVRSTAPARLMGYCFRGPFHHAAVQLDCGAEELGILDVDIAGTLAACQAMAAQEEQVRQQEVAFLREQQIDLVYFDIPPLAARIAHDAGVPSVALGNFTWDFIYENYVAKYPEFAPIVERARQHYALTTLALQTPLGHELTAFPRRERIPLVAKRATRPRGEVRAALGLGEHERVMLLGLRGNVVEALAPVVRHLPFTCVAFGGLPTDASNCRLLPEQWQTRFPDVLAASDVVLSKPGYGIVGECLANARPLLHLDRRDFAEKDYLIADMDRLMAHRQLDPENLDAETLCRLAEEVMAEPPLKQPVDCTGAAVAAGHMLAVLKAGMSERPSPAPLGASRNP